MMTVNEITQRFEALRPELTTFLHRVVHRLAIADELVQETAVRLFEHPEKVPVDVDGFRAWCFRIASNLGVDHCRRAGTLRETLMSDARHKAESSPEFTVQSLSLRGSPEMKAIAREHLVACFHCTLGQLDPESAVTLLLCEVYGFGTQEVADMLDARFAQAKHWLQSARASMLQKYDSTCALINKQGVCYQCVELDGYFDAKGGNPLAFTPGRLDDRIRILRDTRSDSRSRWTHMLDGLLEEIR